MAVYVDNAMIPYRGMKMSHMLADSNEELVAMAELIGMFTIWIQNAGTAKEHFDVSAERRLLALEYGAIEISSREAVLLIRAKRKLKAA